eukprot:GILJ01009877.1.p1 GENE.GILJ01009877.1~~GILJ01009877.1.p1  ORF type:complete len:582 (-),score=74.99 GILJ01009877.1:226-1971(-)
MGNSAAREEPGVIAYSNGDRYEGGRKNGQRHGHGVYQYSNGERYEGDWVSNMKDGFGTFFYKNGELYAGEWRQNAKKGFGVYYYITGDKYEGEWDNNMKSGYGSLFSTDGSKYCGDFANNRKHGQGIWTDPEGNSFAEVWTEGECLSRTPLSRSERPSPNTSLASSTSASTHTKDANMSISNKQMTSPDHEDVLTDKMDSVNSVSKTLKFTAEGRKPVLEWTKDEVANWLTEVNLESYVSTFLKHEISGAHLFSLTNEELKHELGMEAFGHRKQFGVAVDNLRKFTNFGKTEDHSLMLDDTAKCFMIDYKQLKFGKKIGEGGYGRVYRGKWLGKDVALKVFRQRHLKKDMSREFIDEVAVMSKLRHPNIVLYMGASVSPPHYVIMTEYLNRGSLFDLLHVKRMRLDSELLVHVAKSIALGMCYLHQSGVLHCDLKSSNILVDEFFNVKISDFGLSRLKSSISRLGGRIGTPHWMAPEVLRGGEYSEAADVYSYGMILWEMLTQQVPYVNLSAVQIVGSVGYGKKRPSLPECPEGIRRLLTKCWDEDSTKRPSFSEVVARLDRLCKRETTDIGTELSNFLFG